MPPKRKAETKENVPPKRGKNQAKESSTLDDGHKVEEVSVPADDIVPPKIGDAVEAAKEEIRDLPAEASSEAKSNHKAEKILVPIGNQIPPKIDHADATVNDEAKLPEELLKIFDKQPPGKLLIAGMVTWDLTSGHKANSETKHRPNLFFFNRFTSDTYRSAVTGCCSAHSVLITMDRKALAFGRNQHHQLGQIQSKTFEKPTPVSGLEGVNVVQAACGRNHTLFLTDTGAVYACGDNRNGQCGIGSSISAVTKATRVKYAGPPIVKVDCGAEFSMILDINGDLYSFGLPEYGQLGHNTDGKYFITANKLAFHYETRPRKIVMYVEKSTDGRSTTPIEGVKILDFACGNNHTVAIDSKNRAFCWGFGGYGRLGHAEQKDEFVPRLNKLFEIQRRKVMRVFCGATYSLAITDIGGFYMFGRKKPNGDANMYPKPVQDLAGWNITSVGAGHTSVLISAEDTLIAWGAAPTFGELGLGDVLKSSSVPKIVPGMEGIKIPHVSTGYSHSLLLVDVKDESTKQKYEKLAEFVVD